MGKSKKDKTDVVQLTKQVEDTIKDKLRDITIKTRLRSAFKAMNINIIIVICISIIAIGYVGFKFIKLNQFVSSIAVEVADNESNIEALKNNTATDTESINELLNKLNMLVDLHNNSLILKDIIVVSIFIVILLGILLNNILLRKRWTRTLLASIEEPIDELTHAMEELANGNLNTEIHLTGNDEFGKLAESAKKTMINMKAYIDNISEVLNKLVYQDMTATVDIEYKGDFEPIKESLESIVNAYHEIFLQIQRSTSEVSVSAEQISNSATELAEGATEQSAAVEELVATIDEVSEHVNMSADKAKHVSTISSQSLQEAEKGNQYMKELLTSMTSISQQSNEISNIIQVINGIAEETNLLALNASIEAARAGEQGKGFAVVASEIGKLAKGCSEAAETTKKLIVNSIQAVEQGSKLADETADVLNQVVNTSKESSNYVEEIAKASISQAYKLQEVLKGIQQIAVVVETNSETARKSAEASDTLLVNTETLSIMMQDFIV